MARFDCAVWRPISANTGGSLGPNLGLILHHAVARGSLWSFFNSPSAQVSAHFWVSQSGLIEQYVDTATVAWHGKQLNSRYVGVETEGCNVAPYAEPMSEEMINSLALIYAEGIRRHGWQARLANSDGEPGFGYHRMAVNTACPCDERLSKRQEILNRATGVKPPTITEPEPLPEVDDMLIASTFRFNGLYHVFYVTKSHGQLWHKFSTDGIKWDSHVLMTPSNPTGAAAGAVQTGAKLIECVAPQPDERMATVTCYAEDNQVWICRQEKDSANWDRRRL